MLCWAGGRGGGLRRLLTQPRLDCEAGILQSLAEGGAALVRSKGAKPRVQNGRKRTRHLGTRPQDVSSFKLKGEGRPPCLKINK